MRKAYQLYKIGGVVSEILYSPATYGLDLSVLNMPKPRARISALVSVFTYPLLYVLKCSYTVSYGDSHAHHAQAAGSQLVGGQAVPCRTVGTVP